MNVVPSYMYGMDNPTVCVLWFSNGDLMTLLMCLEIDQLCSIPMRNADLLCKAQCTIVICNMKLYEKQHMVIIIHNFCTLRQHNEQYS